MDKYLLAKDTHHFKTQVERDHAYVALREYNYKVFMLATGQAILYGSLGMMAGLFIKKRYTVLGLLPAIPAYKYFKHRYRMTHNKRIFDMLNVGEEYELGF